MNVEINLQQLNSVVYVVYLDYHRLIVDVIVDYLDVYWNFYDGKFIIEENFFSSYVGLTIRQVDVGDDRRSLMIASFKKGFCCLSSTSSKSKSGKFGSDEVNMMRSGLSIEEEEEEKNIQIETKTKENHFKVQVINSCFHFCMNNDDEEK